jgi:hypothetical protein
MDKYEHKNEQTKNLLVEKSTLIKELHEEASYGNLRNLKQAIIEFERIFKVLPERVREKPAALEDILRVLMALSIEIRRASILPNEIMDLFESHRYHLPINESYPRQMRTDEPDEKKAELADQVLVNDHQALLLPSILACHEKFSTP